MARTSKRGPSLNVLAARAVLYRQIRQYFDEQGVLEVDVPVLGRSASLDPNLDAMVVADDGPLYLQTSPEYFHKRLLASGSGSIFSLTRAFRRGEQGRLHNPEFAILEWYRVHYAMQELIEDVVNLLRSLFPDLAVTQATYADLFEAALNINPHRASEDEINRLVAEHSSYRGKLSSRAGLELLFSQVLEAQMADGLQVVTHYPQNQAALARLTADAQGNRVALRFEVFINGLELANGYQELTDAEEQRARFALEQEERRSVGLAVPDMDEKLLQALEQGMPECSGVALGLDRLLMIRLGADHLAEVLSFDWGDL